MGTRLERSLGVKKQNVLGALSLFLGGDERERGVGGGGRE